MSTPRRAAPEDDTDLADVARSWRRYLILVICGVIVAVLGLGIFGYLAWWSLCDQAAGVCQRGEPVMYWCSVVARLVRYAFLITKTTSSSDEWPSMLLIEVCT